MGDLLVELFGHPVGHLAGDWRSFDFNADSAAVDRHGLDSTVLSVAVPLSAHPRRADKVRRQNFFAGLLPEGAMLDRLARESNLAIHDTIGLLRRYGRDVAGALEIWDPEAPGEPRQPTTETADTAGVADLLRRVQQEPLGNRPVGGKTSLAGVQDKIVLARIGGEWQRVLDGFPSTHILKPAQARQPTLIHDEEFGLRLARSVGMTPCASWVEDFEEIPALVIERYDRRGSRRLHQEDFAQALGLSGNEKYQRHGGRASLARIAKVLVEHADPASLTRLAVMAVFAVAIGNLDLHAKNISLLHGDDGSITLAPAYDLVPMTHQPNDGEVALAINGKYRHATITGQDLVDEIGSWGLRSAAEIVKLTLEQMRTTIAVELPTPRAHPTVASDITRFVENLLAGRAAGD